MFLDFRARMRNAGFWISLASALSLVLQVFYPVFDTAKYNDIVNTLLSVLTVLGVINNPTTQTHGILDDPLQQGAVQRIDPPAETPSS